MAKRKNHDGRVSLARFVENPNNPSTATDADIERLAGKMRRVPLGLMAMRIAYVTDMAEGVNTVISGNKRLRVLKRTYGDDGEVPAEWFADVTGMSEAERHEFIIDANVSDGEWDLDRLVADYSREELADCMKPEELDALLRDVAEPDDADVEKFDDLDNGEVKGEEICCRIGRLQIPMTQREADLVEERYDAYVKRQSCGFGFFFELLGEGENG